MEPKYAIPARQTAHREMVQRIEYPNGGYYGTMRSSYPSQGRSGDRGRQIHWWNKPFGGLHWVDCPACGEERILGPRHHECKSKATAVRPRERWTDKVRARLLRWLDFKATTARLRGRSREAIAP